MQRPTSTNWLSGSAFQGHSELWTDSDTWRTDRQTDRRTDGRTDGLNSYIKVRMLTRGNKTAETVHILESYFHQALHQLAALPQTVHTLPTRQNRPETSNTRTNFCPKRSTIVKWRRKCAQKKYGGGEIWQQTMQPHRNIAQNHLLHSCEVLTIYYKVRKVQNCSRNNKVRKSSKKSSNVKLC